MPGTIEENTQKILKALASLPTDDMGSAEISGDELADITGLSPADINHSVSVLVDAGLVEWQQYMGTAPYDFGEVGITARGRYELERTEKYESQPEPVPVESILPPTPVGSPYGFQDEDWEVLAERKADVGELHVCLGYQFKSKHYDSAKLSKNIENSFRRAVDDYNQLPNAIQTELNFRALAAGYGEHLFNEIARDIIASDIAVFETSDFNANVMIEMGVALTWGVRVLPIKAHTCEKPPSDISGQTWVDYRDSGKTFVDTLHQRKLVRMIERALRKKVRR